VRRTGARLGGDVYGYGVQTKLRRWWATCSGGAFRHSVDWGLLMSGSTLASIPVLAVFVVFQRQILSGLLAGSEK